MKNNLREHDICALIREPETHSCESYEGSYWNEFEKDSRYEIFEIFEVLSFRPCELFDNHRVFEEVHSPEVLEGNAVYNYLLAQSKKLFSLTDEEVYLIWNWNIGKITPDGFFLFFEAQQYEIYKTPNYYNSNEARAEYAAFKSLLSKLRSHHFYAPKQ